MRYSRGNTVTATSSGYSDTRHAPGRERGKEIPWLMVMAAIIIIVLFAFFLLALKGYIH